jgi:hypothetical protein
MIPTARLLLGGTFLALTGFLGGLALGLHSPDLATALPLPPGLRPPETPAPPGPSADKPVPPEVLLDRLTLQARCLAQTVVDLERQERQNRIAINIVRRRDADDVVLPQLVERQQQLAASRKRAAAARAEASRLEAALREALAEESRDPGRLRLDPQVRDDVRVWLIQQALLADPTAPIPGDPRGGRE